jgi:RimJ/RimL family protein N-acetyltransferase
MLLHLKADPRLRDVVEGWAGTQAERNELNKKLLKEVELPHYKKLVGEKCYLSPCAPEDAEKWAAWDNDPEVALPLGDEAHTLFSLEAEQESIARIQKNHDPIFSILDLATGEVIGRGMLFDVNRVDRCAELGIVIGEKSYWNRDYGQDATRLLLEFGFNYLNLNSILLGVFSFNERAIACYRKIGFREIGRRRQARLIAGKWHDVVFMDLLADEFRIQKT